MKEVFLNLIGMQVLDISVTYEPYQSFLIREKFHKLSCEALLKGLNYTQMVGGETALAASHLPGRRQLPREKVGKNG